MTDIDGRKRITDVLNSSLHGDGHGPVDVDLESRVSVLEEGIETTDEELYRLGHDFKFLLVEIGLVLDWIKDKFGVELINKESQIYKHIHHDLGSDEITAMKRSLALPLQKSAQTAKSERPAQVSNPTPSLETEEALGNSEPEEGEDDREKDPDFDVRAAAAEDHGHSLVPVAANTRRSSSRVKPVKRRRGSTSSGSSLESSQLQHHQRQAWRERSRSRAKRGPPTQPPSVTPFVRKLWRMVDEPATNQIIEWGSDGSGFLIHDQFILAQDLLPVNFKHNNIASFVRQLNWYGFRKYPGLDAECRFVHKYFKRGRPDLLIKVRRRVSEPDGARALARARARVSRSQSRSRSCSKSPSPSPVPYKHGKRREEQEHQDDEEQEQTRAEEEDPFENLDLEEMEEVTPYDPDPGPGGDRRSFP